MPGAREYEELAVGNLLPKLDRPPDRKYGIVVAAHYQRGAGDPPRKLDGLGLVFRCLFLVEHEVSQQYRADMLGLLAGVLGFQTLLVRRERFLHALHISLGSRLG